MNHGLEVRDADFFAPSRWEKTDDGFAFHLAPSTAALTAAATKSLTFASLSMLPTETPWLVAVIEARNLETLALPARNVVMQQWLSVRTPSGVTLTCVESKRAQPVRHMRHMKVGRIN